MDYSQQDLLPDHLLQTYVSNCVELTHHFYWNTQIIIIIIISLISIQKHLMFLISSSVMISLYAGTVYHCAPLHKGQAHSEAPWLMKYWDQRYPTPPITMSMLGPYYPIWKKWLTGFPTLLPVTLPSVVMSQKMMVSRPKTEEGTPGSTGWVFLLTKF